MEELKKAYKLVKYGLRLKTQLGFAVLFAAIGLIFEIMTRGSQFIGTFYLVLAGMFLYQLVISVDVSTLVQSSPYKKKIQILFPYVVMIPWTYLVMTVLTIIHWFFAKGDAQAYANQCRLIMLLGVILFFTCIYFGFCYKYFFVSCVLLFAIMIPVMMLFQLPKGFIYEMAGKSYALSVTCAYVLTTLGLALSYLSSKALYRKKLSRYAFKAALSKSSR